jgi:hypothetical protein
MRNEPAEETVWYFCQDPEGRWRWGAVSADGAVVVRSAERFPSRSQSMEDATIYGYAANDGRVQRMVNRA